MLVAQCCPSVVRYSEPTICGRFTCLDVRQASRTRTCGRSCRRTGCRASASSDRWPPASTMRRSTSTARSAVAAWRCGSSRAGSRNRTRTAGSSGTAGQLPHCFQIITIIISYLYCTADDWVGWVGRFYQGRRSEDDDRQIGRWDRCAGEKGRWKNNLIGKVTPAETKSPQI